MIGMGGMRGGHAPILAGMPESFRLGVKDGIRVDGNAAEVPLGEGSVDFPEYLARLGATGYDGFLTVEREVGDDPVTDIVKAVEFLRTL